MIRIKIAGEYLDIFPDTSMDITLINPAFASDFGRNSESYSFNIPDTPKNRRLTNYASVWLANEPSEMEQDATIFYNTLPLKMGKVVVNQINLQSGTISISFLIDNSKVFDELKSVKLSDLNLGGTRTLTSTETAYMELKAILDVSGDDLVIVINGYTYSYEWHSGSSSEDALTQLQADIDSQAANGVDASVSGTGTNAVLRIESDTVGLTAAFEIDIDSAANQQIWIPQDYLGIGQMTQNAWSTHMGTVAAASMGTYDYVFAPIYNPDFYKETNADFLGYLNLYDPVAGYFIKNEATASNKWRTNVVPFPRLAYILERILNHIGYTDSSTFTSDADFKRLCFYANKALDDTVFDENAGSETFNAGLTSWNMQEHVPDISCSDFINQLSKLLNISVIFNIENKTFDIIENKDIVSANIVDWSEKSTRNYTIEKNEFDGLTYSYKEDSKDGFWNDHNPVLKPLVYLNGNQPIEFKLSPLAILNSNHPINVGNSWRTAKISQLGTSDYFDTDKNDVSVRIFYFGGMQNDSNGDSYPLASGGRTYANTHVGNWGLELLSWFSIPSIRYGKWILSVLQDGRPGKQKVLLNYLDIHNLDFGKRYRLRTVNGEGIFILEEVKVSLGTDGIGITGTKCRRI